MERAVPQLVEMVAPVEDQVHMVPLPMEEVMVLMAMQVLVKAESASTRPHENLPEPPENCTLAAEAEEIISPMAATTVQVVLAALGAVGMEAPKVRG
jgi:hypothetical protein